MPDRNLEGNYRYKFQGQELDKETGKIAFELRLWDSRIGRWLTTDPAGQFFSPYLGMGNNPIRFVDPDGGFACDDCPNGTFEDGTEHIGADGGTYIYDAEIGRWSDSAAVVFTISLNNQKQDQYNMASALMSSAIKTSSIAASIDGPIPAGDIVGGIVMAMAIGTAGGISINAALQDDYTVTTREAPTITLYRGIHSGHPDYANALTGTAVPRNFLDGHSDPVSHNAGDNNSIFTSWTISKSVAENFANSHGPGGLVLMKRFRYYEPIPSLNVFNEGEFLIPGIVTGATVLGRPSVFK